MGGRQKTPHPPSYLRHPLPKVEGKEAVGGWRECRAEARRYKTPLTGHR
jgi:hypothetical protein